MSSFSTSSSSSAAVAAAASTTTSRKGIVKDDDNDNDNTGSSRHSRSSNTSIINDKEEDVEVEVPATDYNRSSNNKKEVEAEVEVPSIAIDSPDRNKRSSNTSPSKNSNKFLLAKKKISRHFLSRPRHGRTASTSSDTSTGAGASNAAGAVTNSDDVAAAAATTTTVVGLHDECGTDVDLSKPTIVDDVTDNSFLNEEENSGDGENDGEGNHVVNSDDTDEDETTLATIDSIAFALSMREKAREGRVASRGKTTEAGSRRGDRDSDDDKKDMLLENDDGDHDDINSSLEVDEDGIDEVLFVDEKDIVAYQEWSQLKNKPCVARNGISVETIATKIGRSPIIVSFPSSAAIASMNSPRKATRNWVKRISTGPRRRRSTTQSMYYNHEEHDEDDILKQEQDTSPTSAIYHPPSLTNVNQEFDPRHLDYNYAAGGEEYAGCFDYNINDIFNSIECTLLMNNNNTTTPTTTTTTTTNTRTTEEEEEGS
mmetsp:Transcript_51899/g.57932  ORF Transcript_51899/g.57932 Transcript_51899/m.57932 type:complete len:484 (-) Transcript_51899:590-2041(-)